MFPIKRSVLSYFLEPQSSQSNTHTPSLPSNTIDITSKKEVPSEPAKRYMDIFCDGACSRNGKRFAKAGFGLHVRLDGATLSEVSEPLNREEPQTNQRAELRALERALEYAIEAPEDVHVRIYTDSEYGIDCITKWAFDWRRRGWIKSDGKEVQHKDVIADSFRHWLSVNGRTTIEHVRAHTNKSDWKSLGNKRADELAVASIK